MFLGLVRGQVRVVVWSPRATLGFICTELEVGGAEHIMNAISRFHSVQVAALTTAQASWLCQSLVRKE